jgi:hypothetical protein
MDPRALKLLEYLAQRVTIAVGDNLGRLAAGLGLAAEEFEAAALDLCARGLATREPVSDGVYRLGVTDPGVALLREQGYRPAAAPRRGWRALWPFS